jgi:hypothetical protein
MYYVNKDCVIEINNPIRVKIKSKGPMKRRSTFSAIGGYQPFLFCIGMYVVALFFSIFICSAIFYTVNPKKSIVSESKTPNKQQTAMVKTGGQQVLLTVAK